MTLSKRLHLDIETGVGAVDYEELAKVEHLDGECHSNLYIILYSFYFKKYFFLSFIVALEVTVRRLNDRVTAIRREQNYQRV